jgi:single-strand DNA-binding protein
VDVVADNVQFLGGRSDSDDGATSGGGGGQARRGGERGGRREEVDINEEDFEDIPFAHLNTKPLIVRSIL